MQDLPIARLRMDFDDSEIRREAKRYKALGDETRLKMFKALQQEEHCVCELMELFQMNQSVVSHHVKILENAGLVQGHRVGKFVYYRLSEDESTISQ